MHPFNHYQKIYLGTTIALSLLLVAPINGIQPELALSEKPDWTTLEKKDPPTGDGRGGARGPVCPIAPALPQQPGQWTKIWTTQPLFLWQGPVRRMEVRALGSQQILWIQQVTTRANQIVYQGFPLSPGKSYTWALFDQRDRLMLEIPFEILSVKQRGTISSDLNSLRIGLQQPSPEQLAWHRANYFVAHQLWLDALQEAFSVAQPSAQLTTFRQSILKSFCP